MTRACGVRFLLFTVNRSFGRGPVVHEQSTVALGGFGAVVNWGVGILRKLQGRESGRPGPVVSTLHSVLRWSADGALGAGKGGGTQYIWATT